MAFSVEFIRRFEDAREMFLSLMDKQGFKLMEEKKMDYGEGYIFERDGHIIDVYKRQGMFRSDEKKYSHGHR